MNENKEQFIEDILTPEQEKFCVNYTQNYEFFGNATLAYADAFGHDLDGQPKDDAQYKAPNGEIYAEFELLDLPISATNHILKCKKIQESSYKRMYDNVSTYGSKLRKRMNIQARCRDLLNEFLINNVIDARLAEIILDGNNSDSLKAIQEFNKLRQRIVEKKDITSDGKAISISFDPIFNEKTAQQTEGDNIKQS